MNYHRPTELHEKANADAMTVFAEHMSQFKGVCDALHNIEGNLSTIGNDALKAVLLSPGRVIQTDDGAEWRHDVDLSKITSICHRRTAAGLEFAVVECLPLKSGEMKSVLNSGHNVQDLLREFMRDQRQVLNLWKDDVKAHVREHLGEKYPGQDMGIVVESFEIKMARAISETRIVAHQSQSRGIRI
ncbi:MAG TPA: hypothetical protein VMA35_02720 [Candidatus Sulfopaludibacter sp.]|nr:hypothetical protein [Candidatus Sulfopaludibacter sp.]